MAGSGTTTRLAPRADVYRLCDELAAKVVGRGGCFPYEEWYVYV